MRRANGPSLNIKVTVWYNKKTDAIHIASNDPAVPGFISTVNHKAGSERCHKNLFRKLARQLIAAGKPGPRVPDAAP